MQANEFTLTLLVIRGQPGGHQYIGTLCHHFSVSTCHLAYNNAASTISTNSVNLLLASQISTSLFCHIINV